MKNELDIGKRQEIVLKRLLEECGQTVSQIDLMAAIDEQIRKSKKTPTKYLGTVTNAVTELHKLGLRVVNDRGNGYYIPVEDCEKVKRLLGYED